MEPNRAPDSGQPPLTSSAPSGAAPARKVTWGWRWWICFLLFLATTVNYIDRQVLGILAPVLQKEIGWNEVDYSNIVVAFQIAYALGLFLAGRWIDRVGTRVGFAVAITVWSLAAAGHALVRSVIGFAVARFALGLGEAANFPAAIKTVAEWFPRRERAFATGLFNAGSNVGAIVAPLAVPWLALNWGWPSAFVVTGLSGLFWLALWLPSYRPPQEHARLSREELAHIQSDPPEPSVRVGWGDLVRSRQAWAFAIGKFLTDPVWWFYLYWTAKFLDQNHGIKLSQISLPLVAIYLVADVGSIGGGWLSGRLIQSGFSINASRKIALLACALCVVPVTFAPLTNQLWVAVGLVSLAAAAHQGWSANLFTLASDLFPRPAVGAVVGFGGMFGAIGGILFSSATGHILEWTGGNYLPVFVACGMAYLAGLSIIHTLSPRLAPAVLKTHSR